MPDFPSTRPLTTADSVLTHFRSQEPGARSQEPGARSQEPGARSQGTITQGTTRKSPA